MTPSNEDPAAASVEPVETDVGSGAPARRIFRVFFCVTVEEFAVGVGAAPGCGVRGESAGITESGMREVL